MDLNILRLPALAAVPEPDPLVIIAGGPGQSAVDLAEVMLHSLGEIRQHRDLVFVDQRGTGQSHPLDCKDLPDFNSGLDLIHQKQQLLAALSACAQEYGERMLFYTTPYAVEDLDAVRETLGYQRINLWAGSYGTRVALEYLRQHPDRVRTAVLDGLAPVSLMLPWHAEQDALRALTLLDDSCRDECRAQFGDLLAQADAIALRLRAAPELIALEHPRTGHLTEVPLTHESFAGLLRMALYQRDLAQLIPLTLSRASAGDYRTLAALLVLAEAQQEEMGISMGMHYTILCNEDFPRMISREPVDSHHFLGLNLVDGLHEICDFWPRAALREGYYEPVRSDAPLLLLSGQRDPVTPPRWAELTAETLPNSRHLVVPGGHHIVSFEGCLPRLIARYVHSGSHRNLDVSCVDLIQPRAPLRDIGAGERLAEGDMPE
jgi:pimeloyl-ACP methyl ester carboxylesterase